jgi:cytosine/adenosine deaminase-related metal-dependent hydrolase
VAPAHVVPAAGDAVPPAGDDDVVRFWRDLGLPGLVDVHVHFLPARLMDKVWAYFEAAGPLVGTRWPIAYREPEQRRLERLRAMGVRAFSSLVYPHKPGMAAWLNTWAAGFAAEHPDVLQSATFFPEPGVESYLDEALAAGAQVVKVHLQVGGFDPREPVLDGVWGRLAEAGTPVVVHCGHGPVPAAFTGSGPFAEVLARHPSLTAVIAHLGMPEYEAFLALAERYERVHLDTTMAFTDFVEQRTPFPRAQLPRLAALQDRVLLGSDFPNTPYPYSHQLAALARLGLGEAWLRAVLHDNAAALFDVRN